ncbi:MAG: hypothetical protein ABIQ44_07910, partial [Chloroflexia bacterium]
MASPNEDAEAQRLLGVSAVSAGDVWTVGYYQKDGTYRTLIEHWNGTEWSIVPSPNQEAENNLSAVAIISSNNVWAVGNYASSKDDNRTLIEHGNASDQSIVSSPNQGSVESSLSGVASLSPSDAWAVGHYVPKNPNVLTLIE